MKETLANSYSDFSSVVPPPCNRFYRAPLKATSSIIAYWSAASLSLEHTFNLRGFNILCLMQETPLLWIWWHQDWWESALFYSEIIIIIINLRRSMSVFCNTDDYSPRNETDSSEYFVMIYWILQLGSQLAFYRRTTISWLCIE